MEPLLILLLVVSTVAMIVYAFRNYRFPSIKEKATGLDLNPPLDDSSEEKWDYNIKTLLNKKAKKAEEEAKRLEDVSKKERAETEVRLTTELTDTFNTVKKYILEEAKEAEDRTTSLYDDFDERAANAFIEVKDGVLSFSFIDVSITVSDVLYVKTSGAGLLPVVPRRKGRLKNYVNYGLDYHWINEEDNMLDARSEDISRDTYIRRSSVLHKKRCRALDKMKDELPSIDTELTSRDRIHHAEITLACKNKTYTFLVNPIIAKQVGDFLRGLHGTKFADAKLEGFKCQRPNKRVKEYTQLQFIVYDILAEDTVKRDVNITVPVTTKISGHSHSSTSRHSSSSDGGRSSIVGDSGISMLAGIAIGSAFL